MKRMVYIALALSCLLLVSACGGSGTSSGTSQVSSRSSSASSSPAASVTPAPVDPLEARLESMTLEEKVGQLFFARCPDSGAVTDVADYHLGGFVLFGRDFKGLTANEIVQTLNAYQEAAAADTGIPLLLGTDEEGGTVVRVSSNPNICKEKFFSPQQLLEANGLEGLVWDTHEKDVLLKALGINVNLGPVCDVSTDPNDFIYARSMGKDGEDTASCVAAMVSRMSQDRMGSVLKHFPGYGNNTDTHTGVAVDKRPMETFERSDFLPFRSALANGEQTGGLTTALLVSHNIVTCMDPDLPASLSPAVHQLLRTELSGFNGVVMTDDLAMDAVQSYAADGDIAVLALKAGNDMILTTDYRTQIAQLIAAVKDGSLSEDTVDTACRRVLAWKTALGLL